MDAPSPARRCRTVVVTGASAGLGRAIVREFARREPGVNIGLLARGEEGLEGARREVELAGGRALALPTDVSDAAAVEAAAERVERELGPIDVWVNVAMVTVFAPIKETSAEEFRRVTEVTYLGFVHGTLAALRRMLGRDAGTIIQVGSALAYRSIPLQAAYCACKSATRGFTDSLRCELIHDRSNVHVTMVQMPALNTPQFRWSRSHMPRQAQPVPPIYQPEVGARAVYWASKHRRREWWVGLPTVEAIVGQRFIPGLLDYFLGLTGYEGQQTAEKRPADQPDNLYAPLPGDHGAHGVFDARAQARSTEVWLSEHRNPLLVLAAAALGLVGGTLLAKSER